MSSEFFIRRPIFASVVSIVIVLVGVLSLVALPIARYPEIAPPTVKVTAVYPGANAATVAETVATPIEQQVNGVEGMLFMSSTSSSDGQMELTITFEVGTDLDMASVLVQNRVAIAESKLPEEVRRQGVTTKKQSTDMAAVVCLTGAEGGFDGLFLNNYAALRLKDELARVPGVGDVAIFGSGEYGMRIWLEPDELTARGLTTTDIVGAIQEQNVQIAAGAIGQPPAPAGQPFEFTVNAQGRLSDPEAFEQIIVRRAEDGGLVRVRDVATVELGSTSYAFGSKFKGDDAATLMIYQLPGANLLDVVDGVKSTLEALSERFPEGLRYDIAYDATDVINASIREVVITLFITLALVVATVFVFLQSFRATIIPALTIPVSLIGTFAVMNAMGFTINQLTLFGLVLVIGIVVDDAIVVVENCTRHLDEGLSPKDAAIKSMQEVSGPVIATTLVLLAVFVPTAFMGGITGQLYRQFALTIAIATVFSSINALTLSPALAGILMRPTPKKPFILFRLFNALLGAGTSVYGGAVKLTLRLAIIALLLYGGLIAVAGVGFTKLPTGFVPQEDEGWCIVNLQLPDASSLERTQAVADRVEKAMLEIPGVKNTLSITGFSILAGSRASSSATLLVIFEHWDERKDPELIQASIVAKANGILAQERAGMGMAVMMPSLPGLGTSGGFAVQVLDLDGTGYDSLQRAAYDVVMAANGQERLQGVFTGFRANVPQLFVDVDRDQVNELGVRLGDVFATLQAYLGSAYVNDFSRLGRIYPVKLQADAAHRARTDDIMALEVRSQTGEMIPLGAMIEVHDTFGPQAVTRFNGYSSAKVSGNAAPGTSSGQALDLVEQTVESTLPASMGFAWTDISYQQKAAAGGVGLIFALAIMLVYLVLAAQYESWTTPLAVILAVPTALAGAVGGLMLMGKASDVYAQIGIVLLIGLASKSAILIVEFAKELREQGKSVFDASHEAATLRFRAILMTAFSFILGVIPLLIASGAGAESRKVLGTTVFYGMLVSTVVSVIAVPMLFFVIRTVGEKVRGVGRHTP